MSLYSDVVKYVKREGLFDGAATVVVALSGGPDSVCLLDVLSLMRERGDFSGAIVAAHLNHSLRGAESEADESFVRGLCAREGITLEVEKVDVGELHRKMLGATLEEAARKIRYEFLRRVAGQHNATHIATGHNADDQAETVLHRLIRGSGLRGICGMRAMRPLAPDTNILLVRPLLETPRKDILEHLGDRGLAARFDSTNFDTDFLRNKIRHSLLPLIEAGYNPMFRDALLRTARAADHANEFLALHAEKAIAVCVDNDQIDIEKFLAVHPALRPLVIEAAAKSATQTQLSAVHFDAISELAESGQGGAQLDIPGAIVRKVRGKLIFEKREK